MDPDADFDPDPDPAFVIDLEDGSQKRTKCRY